MTNDEATVLRAAHELCNGEPRVIEYKALANRTRLTEAQVRAIAGQLQQQRLCMATFGGLQLTAAGLNAAVQLSGC